MGTLITGREAADMDRADERMMMVTLVLLGPVFLFKGLPYLVDVIRHYEPPLKSTETEQQIVDVTAPHVPHADTQIVAPSTYEREDGLTAEVGPAVQADGAVRIVARVLGPVGEPTYTPSSEIRGEWADEGGWHRVPMTLEGTALQTDGPHAGRTLSVLVSEALPAELPHSLQTSVRFPDGGRLFSDSLDVREARENRGDRRTGAPGSDRAARGASAAGSTPAASAAVAVDLGVSVGLGKPVQRAPQAMQPHGRSVLLSSPDATRR